MQAMTMTGSEEIHHCKNMATFRMEERIGFMEGQMDIIQLMMMQMSEQDLEQKSSTDICISVRYVL